MWHPALTTQRRLPLSLLPGGLLCLSLTVSLCLQGSPATAQAEFRRGDVNIDGVVDIGDVDFLRGFLCREFGFCDRSGDYATPSCREAADVNGDGFPGVPDVIALLSYLFRGAPATLPAPGPDVPGPDPDGGDCQSYDPASPPPLAEFALELELAELPERAGDTITYEILATLTTRANESAVGAAGWSISLGAENLTIVSITTDWTVVPELLYGGFSESEVVDADLDTGSGPQGQGVVSAVASFDPSSPEITLPREGTAHIAVIKAEAVVPSDEISQGSIFFTDGKQGSGQPVRNVVALRGFSLRPELGRLDLAINDCNGNEIPDGREVAEGTSDDCNSNGIPDECEPDCDADGIPDSCEFAAEAAHNFDSYAAGSRIICQGGWAGWDDSTSGDASVSDEQAFSKPNSLKLGADSDVVQVFRGITDGQWTARAKIFVPSGHQNATWFILLARYRHGGPYWYTAQIRFLNGSVQFHDGNAEPQGISLPIEHDAWGEIRIDVDLDNDRQVASYNGQILQSQDWRQGGIGEIQCFDLWSEDGTAVYVDDVTLAPTPRNTIFRRGDCNDDGAVDISDAVCTLDWLFLGGPTPGCVAVTNTNGDEAADISDAVYLLGFLFLGGPTLPEPFPSCGPSSLPSDEVIGCATQPKNCPKSGEG